MSQISVIKLHSYHSCMARKSFFVSALSHFKIPHSSLPSFRPEAFVDEGGPDMPLFSDNQVKQTQ